MICFIHFSHSLEIWCNAGGKYTLDSCRMDLQAYRPTWERKLSKASSVSRGEAVPISALPAVQRFVLTNL